MSSKPNRPIEEQLRKCAERRELEAPYGLELDEVGRRRLQDEVRRVYSEQQPVAISGSGWLWLRIAMVGAAAALVIFVSVQWWPGERPLLLSRQTEPATRSMELPAVPASKRADDEFRRSVTARPPATRGVREELGTAPTTMTEVDRFAPSVAVDAGESSSLTAETSRDQLAPTSPAPFAAPALESDTSLRVAAFQAVGAAETNVSSQQFQQLARYRRNLNSPPPSQVLQSFQWIREGEAVRVIDSDGSVYTGSMALPTGDRFEVSGTNRTLNVRIVFTGAVQQAVEIQSPSAGLNQAGRASSAEGKVQIQGRALVGNTSRLDIVAEPRPSP